MTSFGIGRNGWVRFESADCPPTYLRFLPNELGRWTLRELVVDASESAAITPATLDRLPLAQIEFNVNQHAALIDQDLGSPAPVGGPVTGSNVVVLASHFSTTFAKLQPSNWVALAQQGKPVPKAKPPRGGRVRLDTEYRLTELPDGRLTDEFLTKVARAYGAAMARREAPIRAMTADLRAATGGDYRRSIERWVYQARQRGIMPAGKKGARG
jgi:hypothetical protein